MAEELRSRASEVLGPAALVTRPEIKGGLRIVGFDESVCDIAAAIAEAGGCEASDVTVTPITPMRNGLYMTWVKCPAASALTAAKRGKLTIGWTVVRLELQKPPTPRCFRCWQTGHLKANCTSGQDCTNTCFRCGEPGHKAATCTREAHCVICDRQGLPSRHRLGSYRCSSEIGKTNLQSEESVRRPVANSAQHEGHPV